MEETLTAAEAIGAFFALFVVIGIYLLPTIVALCRRAYYSVATTVINVFFGWTFFGWVLALLLACMNEPRKNNQQIVITQVVGDKNTTNRHKQKDEQDD